MAATNWREPSVRFQEAASAATHYASPEHLRGQRCDVGIRGLAQKSARKATSLFFSLSFSRGCLKKKERRKKGVVLCGNLLFLFVIYILKKKRVGHLAFWEEGGEE